MNYVGELTSGFYDDRLGYLFNVENADLVWRRENGDRKSIQILQWSLQPTGTPNDFVQSFLVCVNAGEVTATDLVTWSKKDVSWKCEDFLYENLLPNLKTCFCYCRCLKANSALV